MKGWSDMETELEKTYLGDGVYVSCDGYHIIVQTDDSGPVYLDPHVFDSLVDYAARRQAV